MLKKDYSPKERLVLALDVDTREEAQLLITQLKDYVGTFKVGLQILTKEGPDIVKMIQDAGCNVFYDGKFHDIPNTVAKASANATRLGVNIFDIHTTGGTKMIAAAVEESRKVSEEMGIQKPTVLGITVLSSLNAESLYSELKVAFPVQEYVSWLAILAKHCGLDGVVASVKEAKAIREVCDENFTILCPGIRPEWAAKNDQARIATPTEAINQGADLLVVGRPITTANCRVSAAQKIIEEIEAATGRVLVTA